MMQWRFVTSKRREIEVRSRRIVLSRALRTTASRTKIAPPKFDASPPPPPQPPQPSLPSPSKVGNAFALRDMAILETRRTRVLLSTVQEEFEKLRIQHAQCVQQVSYASLLAWRLSKAAN